MWSVAAGHPPPRLVRADGRVDVLDGGGPLLGVVPGAAFTYAEAPFGPGDTLVLFSDGLTESIRGTEEWGEDGLDAALAPGLSAHALLDRLVAASDAFAEFVGPACGRRPDGRRHPAPLGVRQVGRWRALHGSASSAYLPRPDSAAMAVRQARSASESVRPRRARTASATRSALSTRYGTSPEPPPHEKLGTCRGGTSDPNTLAKTPTTVPVENAVWMAHFEWSPMTSPRNCRPDGAKPPAAAS